MAINKQANLTVTLNNEQAKRELAELQAEMKRLIDLRDKAQQAGDLKLYKQLDAQLKKATREARNYEKQLADVNTVLKNLSGASINELRKAQQTLTAQTARLNRETAEYAQKTAQLKLVREELSRISDETRSTSSKMERMVNAFNNYWQVFVAGAAAFAGLSLAVKGAVNAYSEFEDRLADVMKTTGLTREEVGLLNEELKKLDTRSSAEELLNLSRIAGKLGITDAKEILGFVKATDQIGVALKEDLGGNVEDAVRELGKLADIFQLKSELGMEQALLKIGSAINELGMASTANEAYLVAFAKRTAGIAPIAGVSIQNILGLAATLDSLGQSAEVSSTAYSQMMTRMNKKTTEFARIAKLDLGEFTRLLREDANEAMLRVFESMKDNSAGLQDLVAALGDIGLEGQRMTSVFGALANNTQTLRAQQKLANDAFREGTSLTNEFNVKNTTAQAELDKARKRFAELAVELGQKLTPAYRSVISRARLMLNTISASIDFIQKYGKAMVVTVATIAAYTLAVNAKNIALRLYNTLTAAATLVTKGFNAALKLSPLGIFISLLSGAATAFYLFRTKTREATREQNEFNRAIQEGNQLLTQTKTLEQRASILKNLSKGQLETLRTDLELQLQHEEDHHAGLLVQTRKRLDEDAELKRLYAQREQQGLTRLQQINLDAQIHARRKHLAADLEELNTHNQKRLKSLQGHLDKVQVELKSRPLEILPDPTSGEEDQKQKEAREKLMRFLEETSEEMQFKLGRYFRKAGETAMEEFFAAIDKKRNEYKDIFEKFEFTPEEETDRAVEYALSKYEQTIQGRHNALVAKLSAGKISEQEFQDQVTELTREAEEQRLKIKLDSIEQAQQLSRMAVSLVASLMDYELEKAGDNEEEKVKIRKKYANVQFLVSASQIVTDTAASIMKGFSELGPIAGAVAAVLLGATGAAQLAIATQERKKMQGYRSGGYTRPGHRDEPAGIVHAGEYVIPQEGVNNPRLREIIDIMEMARRSNALHRLSIRPVVEAMPAVGYTLGGHVQPSATVINHNSTSLASGITPEHILRFEKAIDKLTRYRPPVAIEQIARGLDTWKEIETNRSM